ncbi:MAG: NAD(P)H-hydrate dehydratase [Bacillota bacterium]|jgi:hydroxyethylthiazole kinase-like uncharacterized protein yjeF
MKLVTAEEMRFLDQAAINEYGIPGIILMENAGLAVVNTIKDHFKGNVAQKRIIVFAGKGNNGGDGFVVARHLYNAGADVKIFLLCRPEELQGDAAINWKIIRKMNIRYQVVINERDINLVKIGLMYSELIVDAIFGTGFQGAVQGMAANVIQLVNEAGKPVVAVDLPSGVEANTGCVWGACIKATYTVTFALPKIGLVLDPGARFTGKLVVGDISMPPQLIAQKNISRFLIDAEWCQSRILKREVDSHKGSYGHVVIVGGSPGMTGAVVLAASAAVRSGAGLVTAAVPQGVNSIIEVKVTEAMSYPLPETGDGTLGLAAQKIIEGIVSQKTLVIGPGISRQAETLELVQSLAANIPCPCVIDADALYALTGCSELIKKSSYPVILTPHPGEMAQLLGISIEKVQDNRVEIAQKTARAWNAIIVLKGAKTLVATPEGNLYVNSTGNPGMATGGTGDVLAGMIGAFMAQGINPEEAAALGVFLHGLSGDSVASFKGQRGLAAGDLVDNLPKIIKDFEVL